MVKAEDRAFFPSSDVGKELELNHYSLARNHHAMYPIMQDQMVAS